MSGGIFIFAGLCLTESVLACGDIMAGASMGERLFATFLVVAYLLAPLLAIAHVIFVSLMTLPQYRGPQLLFSLFVASPLVLGALSFLFGQIDEVGYYFAIASVPVFYIFAFTHLILFFKNKEIRRGKSLSEGKED